MNTIVQTTPGTEPMGGSTQQSDPDTQDSEPGGNSMFQVKSLNKMILAQFVAVILPITLVAAFQTAMDLRRSTELESTFRLQGQAHEARAQYKMFVNGVADAVDTGKVGEQSVAALGKSVAALKSIADSASDDKSIVEILSKQETIERTVRANNDVKVMLPLSKDIAATDNLVAELDRRYTDRNSVVVLDNIHSTNRQFVIVSIALLVTLVIAAFLIRMITRGLTQPLTQSVGLARKIARGEIAKQPAISTKRDLGGLLASLLQMNASLHGIIGQVSTASASVDSSAGELSGEANKFATSARAQVAVVATTKTAVEDMNVVLLRVADEANTAVSAARQTLTVAGEGDKNMADSLALTDRVVIAVESSGRAIGNLGQSIQKISGITRMISEIAEQTNLLALNAAIEAARAGDSGRGFAVVADEVRKLAERTTTSTAEISRMVEAVEAETGTATQSMGQVTKEVEAGAQYTRTTAEIFKRIVEAAHNVSEVSERIAISAKEQASAGSTAVEQMQRIDGLSRETTVRVEKVNAAADQLAETARTLKQAVYRFHLS